MFYTSRLIPSNSCLLNVNEQCQPSEVYFGHHHLFGWENLSLYSFLPRPSFFPFGLWMCYFFKYWINQKDNENCCYGMGNWKPHIHVEAPERGNNLTGLSVRHGISMLYWLFTVRNKNIHPCTNLQMSTQKTLFTTFRDCKWPSCLLIDE